MKNTEKIQNIVSKIATQYGEKDNPWIHALTTIIGPYIFNMDDNHPGPTIDKVVLEIISHICPTNSSLEETFTLEIRNICRSVLLPLNHPWRIKNIHLLS